MDVARKAYRPGPDGAEFEWITDHDLPGSCRRCERGTSPAGPAAGLVSPGRSAAEMGGVSEDDPAERPAMIGLPPSARGFTGRPANIADHASAVAQEWEDVGERYFQNRMRELGIPEHLIGEPDYGGTGKRRAFDPHEQNGGGNTTGIVIDSGIFNPELLKGKKGGRVYPHLTARERGDAAIAHEFEELLHGSHIAALKAATKTRLPIMPGARRLCKAMAR
jgi:hypothetical protein